VSGAQGALPLSEATDSSPIPFEGKSSASSSAPFQDGGAGQTGGKRGRKGSKGNKKGKSQKGGCGGGSCVMGGGSKLPVQSPANFN
jgi:hypothetical protein